MDIHNKKEKLIDAKIALLVELLSLEPDNMSDIEVEVMYQLTNDPDVRSRRKDAE